jgi:class 3 adenylate cyclase
MPSGDDLFVTEEGVISAAEKLLADNSFDSAAERQHFEKLLKNYQKLFRTARRLMRLGDHNERQLNAAAGVIAQKNKELEALSIKLSKYLSPQIYKSIFTGAQGVEIASNRKKLTIFFSDVVNFTETTDKLESEDLTNLLNRYLTEMSDIALRHGATIDKYIGDAIMVFFGDPETRGLKEDALACVRMAVDMARRMRALRSEWQELGAEKPFRVRIGINTGYVTVGNFGSNDRMEYTIIGNAVNLTARLQSHAAIDGILMGHETYSLVKDEIAAEERSPIKVKGFTDPIRCYEVLHLYDDRKAEGSVIREEKDGFKFLLNLEKHDKTEAIRAIEAILTRLKG